MSTNWGSMARASFLYKNESGRGGDVVRRWGAALGVWGALALGCGDDDSASSGASEGVTDGTWEGSSEGGWGGSMGSAGPSGGSMGGGSGGETDGSSGASDWTTGGASGTTGGASGTSGGVGTSGTSGGMGTSGTSGSSGGSTSWPDEDVCDSSDNTCKGDKLLTCEGGELKETLCSQAWCAKQGLGNPLGCGYKGGEPGCQCEPALECVHGESECVGPDSGKDCVEGSWTEELSCDTYCQQNGYDLSLSCTQVGTTAMCDCRFSCKPGVDKYLCSSDWKGIYACEGSGAWSGYMDCGQVCKDLGWIGSTGCQWFNNHNQYACSCF